jgi:hypothetical protein
MDPETSSCRDRGTSISDAICTIEIDRRQHGLPRTVVDRLAAEQDLLVALRDDA